MTLSLIGTLSKGGPVLYLLLLCSVISIALAIERALFWAAEKRRISTDDIQDYVHSFHTGREDKDCQQFCKKNPILCRMEVARRGNDFDGMLEVLQVELNYASGRVFRNLRGIETIVAIAPLLGILGTVLGIIKSFSALDLGRLSNPAAVGAGLAEALITTAAGLIVAVPSLVIYNLLRSVGERHLNKIEASAEELFLLTAKNRRGNIAEEKQKKAAANE